MGWLDIILTPVRVVQTIAVDTYEKPLSFFNGVVSLGETLASPFTDYTPDALKDIGTQIRDATRPPSQSS
ncbi:hypothetical protein QQZ08_001793 [Neonectria magnoliae]|uniref:Uncharacterized protein n=1 Tax=Neonectria magnoliae TaxID=2732573 RepID=A0ABR1IEC5_9HYPO